MKLANHENDIRTIDSSVFKYNKEDRVMLCEASSIGPLRDGMWWLQRIYNDAADLGIAIKSSRTGNVERFYLHKVNKSGGDMCGGDVYSWHFKPVKNGVPVFEVIIFND